MSLRGHLREVKLCRGSCTVKKTQQILGKKDETNVPQCKIVRLLWSIVKMWIYEIYLKIQLLGIGFLKSAIKHSVLDPFLE